LRILKSGARVKKLNVTQEQINQIKEATSKNRKSWYFRKEAIRRIIGSSPCFSCSGIPSIEVVWDVKEAIRKESYCEKCSLSLFEREKDLPTDKKALGDYYNLELQEVTI
jgi:hypothetical protein